MHCKKIKLSAILLLGLGLTGLRAQEVIPATGGDASGSGGTVSYSVGQVVNTTNSGATGTITQGVQQPYEIFVVTGLPEATGINLVVSAYPNPTTDFLTLKIDNDVQSSQTLSQRHLSYQLSDVNGKLLESKKIESNKTNIVMSNFIRATYFLKVIRDDKEVIIFKIVKN